MDTTTTHAPDAHARNNNKNKESIMKIKMILLRVIPRALLFWAVGCSPQPMPAEPVAESCYGENVIARTLWAEARSEGERGLRLVATVIHTRSQATGRTYEEVCVRKRQFSCWGTGYSDKRCVPPAKSISWHTCLKIQQEMLSGTFKPDARVAGVRHYYATSIKAPKWAHGKPSKRFGRHVFVSDVQ